MMAEQGTPPNSARFAFLNPKARDFFAAWEQGADDIVAVLRSTAGKNPDDKDLIDLVGGLSTRCEEVRTRWPGTTPHTTAPAANASTTQSWATWTWAAKPSNCPRKCPSGSRHDRQ